MTAQDVVVFLIVLAAVAYLGRTLVLSASGRKSCGGCGAAKKCGGGAAPTAGAAKPAANDQLIQIGLNGGFSASRNGHGASRKRESTPPDH